MAMEAADPRLAASTYALFMAVSNLSVTGGSFFSRLNESLGDTFRVTFLVVSLITMLALFLIRPLSQPATPAAPSTLPEAHDDAPAAIAGWSGPWPRPA